MYHALVSSSTLYIWWIFSWARKLTFVYMSLYIIIYYCIFLVTLRNKQYSKDLLNAQHINKSTRPSVQPMQIWLCQFFDFLSQREQQCLYKYVPCPCVIRSNLMRVQVKLLRQFMCCGSSVSCCHKSLGSKFKIEIMILIHARHS